jgi:hypothetical protein
MLSPALQDALRVLKRKPSHWLFLGEQRYTADRPVGTVWSPRARIVAHRLPKKFRH